MRVLIFRHVPFEGAGYLEGVFAVKGIAFDYADLYQPAAALPSLNGYSGVVILGGPMSVNDGLPYLQVEAEYIGEAIASARPVLGICLGAQLIAKILGAVVRSNGGMEIGWFDVQFADAASGDPLFSGLRTATVFHWHGETFDLPPDAVLLASSDRCRNQAYRVGDRIYGMQFHLEVTPEMIVEWCIQDYNYGNVRELTLPVDPYYNAPHGKALAESVFGRWCDTVRGFALRE